MFEDFDAANGEKQEEDEDSETLSYSYPSYSRFTYTGKTKSRLGRSRFMRQTNNKDEMKKSDDDHSASSELRSFSNFLAMNSQAPKTPGANWFQRDSLPPYKPFQATPGGSHGNSTNVHGNHSELNSFPLQSNFLLNLKGDSVQSSSCKRNLPFNSTPFKSQENQGNVMRDLNNFLDKPFPKLDFSNKSKEENKENVKTETEIVKSNGFDPSWNQLKKICDAAISYPVLPPKVNETNDIASASNRNDAVQTTNEFLRPNPFAPFNIFEKRDEKKKDDDSSNIPLDLSYAESLVGTSLFDKGLRSGRDNVDSGSNTSESLNNLLKESSKIGMDETAESTTQKTNTDALSGFLPKFLVPKNKTNMKESLTDDDSSISSTAHSIGTTVERGSNFNSQTPKVPVRGELTSNVNQDNGVVRLNPSDSNTNRSESLSSVNYKTTLHNDVLKKSPPFNLIHKQPISTSITVSENNETMPSTQLVLSQKPHQNISPPNVSGSSISFEPNTVSPPSDQRVPDPKHMGNLNIVQKSLKDQEQFHQQHIANSQMHLKSKFNCTTPNCEKVVVETLTTRVDENLGIVSKISSDKIANHINLGKNIEPVQNAVISSFNSHLCPSSLSKEEIKLLGSHLNTLANTQQQVISNPQIQNSSDPLNRLYRPETKNEVRAPIHNSMNQPPIQQVNNIPKLCMIDNNRDSAMHNKPPENIESAQVVQKTYLAPQPSLDSNVGDFVKPEIPQLMSSKPSFSAMKKPAQFKMSVPRGMPSRADTELIVSGKSYAILSMLGKGGSSEVYQVLDPRSSKLLAVKCVDLSMVDKTIAEGYLNEIDLLSKLQGCASVIRMFDYEYVQECKMLYVVMEKGDTDLSHLIRDISKTKKISMSMIIYYWTEMLQAVKDIHDQGIIHSDLKPANFLLVSGRLKLIDFGIASSQGDMTSVVKEVTTGTWNYMSPEAIKNTSASGKGFKITYKSDVWSLGCILYNLVYGKTPFSHITNTWGKLTAIADPNHHIEFPDVGTPAVLDRALRSCFHREPKSRPTVAELLGLPYHSTGANDDLVTVGRQVQALLPPQWWGKVAHLFQGVKSNQEEKHTDNAG